MKKLINKIKLWWFYLPEESQEGLAFLAQTFFLAFLFSMAMTYGILVLSKV